jgi:hypothetical protein
MMPLRQVGISVLRGSGGVHVYFAEFGNRRDRRGGVCWSAIKQSTGV